MPGFGFGAGSARGRRAIIASGGAPSLSSTINYLGETFTLSQPMEVGYTLNGQPYIVTSTAGSWASSSTPSTVIDGYVAHGAMFDPRIVGTPLQGFDEMLAYGNLGTTSLGTSGSTPWSAALNIDPAASGAFNLTGKVGRLTKAVRVTGGGLGEFCLLQKVININLVPSTPPADAICPIFDGLGGVEWMRASTVSKMIFAGDGYISGEESLTSCIANNYLPGDTDWPMWIDNGERRRGLMPRRSWWSTGYSRDFGGVWNKLINACHAEGGAAVPDAIFYRMLTLGALSLENVRRGNVGRGGAGQNVGIKPMAVLAGMASRNSAHYALAKQHEGNETHQAFWPTSEFTNINTGFPNGQGGGYNNRQPFLPEHYGRASFFHGDQDVAAVSPTYDTDLYDSDLNPRYQLSSWPYAVLGLANCLRFVNGAGGKTGLNLVTNDGPILPTNPYSACIPAMLRYTALGVDLDPYVDPFPSTFPTVRTRSRQTLMAVIGSAAMTPDPVGPQVNQSTYLTPTATGFSWNYTTWDIGGPIKPITRVDHRMTLDGGRTFLVENNVGETGSKATGVPYNRDVGVQNRRWSADGAGPWSVNYPKVQIGVPSYPLSQVARFVIRPTGTASGAPTNIQPPGIVVRPLNNWAGPYYQPAPVPLPVNTLLYAGLGWWAGDLSAAPTYQWYVGAAADGSDKTAISGATSDTYTVASASMSKYITLGVTIGGVTAFSSPTQVESPVYPAMTLTTFDGVNDCLNKNTALTGAVAGRKLTFSMTGAMAAGTNALAMRLCTFGDNSVGTSSGSQLFSIERRTTGALQVIIRQTGGTGVGNNVTIFNGTTTTNALTAEMGEVTVTVTIDLDAARYQVYVNDTAVAWATAPTVAAADIPFQWMIRPRLFASLVTSPALTAVLSFNHRCTFFHTDSLDISVLGNRNKLKPANIGNRGEGVFGTDALVMLYGPAASIGANYGTGGNYTLVGAVTDVP